MKHLNTYINEFLINNHTSKPNIAFVDLDLPSGTLWAKCNLGAERENEVGDYYMFGETKPSTDKRCWADQTIFMKPGNTRYTSSYFIDNKDTWFDYDILKKEYDAAYVDLGEKCHIPTEDQCRELIKHTEHIYSYDEETDIPVIIFESKKNKDNYISISLGGYKSANDFCEVTNEFNLWTSNISRDDKITIFYGESTKTMSTNTCIEVGVGLNIRPVKDK